MAPAPDGMWLECVWHCQKQCVIVEADVYDLTDEELADLNIADFHAVTVRVISGPY